MLFNAEYSDLNQKNNYFIYSSFFKNIVKKITFYLFFIDK